LTEAKARLTAHSWHDTNVCYLRKLGRELERRRFALTDTIHRHGSGRIEITGISAGMHVVAKIRELPWSRFDELQSAANSMGLRLTPIRPQLLSAEGDVVVLLGFSAAAPAIADAAHCLCRAVSRVLD
jgi:DNA-binding transcriptional MocR family regulator